MGAVALHTLFPGHNMEMEHGLPFIASWGAWEGVVVPMYHPAAGIHSGRLMLPIQQDWRHFGTLLTSMDFDRVADAFPNPDYRECTDAWDVRQYMELAGGRPLAIDTEVETLVSMIPYCLSFSHSPGTSRVIQASSTAALRELHAYILSTTGHLIFHNALFDPPVLANMGLTGVLNHKFHDTMMMAYLLGDSAQSLKILAYRECGMVMEEFVDVAFGPSKEVAMMWLVDAIHALTPKPIGTRIPKTGKRKGQSVPVFAKGKTGNEQSLMLANRALADCLDDDKPEMDPWARYKGWDTDVQSRITNAAGSPMPPLSIIHVPWSSALYYAARDADATIRLYPYLAAKSMHVGRITL